MALSSRSKENQSQQLLTSPIPVVVVGGGWVGTHRHIPALYNDPRFRLVGVVDSDRQRAAAAARSLQLRSAAASSLAELPWLDEVQAVSIATPPASHARLLAEARALGLHALTEKPFTLEMKDAEQAAQPGGPVLAIMHNFQFMRAMQRLSNDVETGRLGRLRSVSAGQLSNAARRLPTWYESLPLGLFFDESPHLLYLLSRLLPDLILQNVDVARAPGRATPQLVSVRYAAGRDGEIPVSLSMNFMATVSEWWLAVHGERAVGVVDLFRDIYVCVPNDGSHTTASVLRSSAAASAGHWLGFLGSGALHLRGRLRYGVDGIVGRFAEGIVSGTDPEACGRVEALAVRRMQQEIIDRAGHA